MKRMILIAATIFFVNPSAQAAPPVDWAAIIAASSAAAMSASTPASGTVATPPVK